MLSEVVFWCSLLELASITSLLPNEVLVKKLFIKRREKKGLKPCMSIDCTLSINRVQTGYGSE
jgi:hypothetical protein